MHKPSNFMHRHSGAGRNPALLFNRQFGFVRYAECFFELDSGLRRNDAECLL